MREIHRVEDICDEEGWITTPGYTWWKCTNKPYTRECGKEVRRYRGEGDVSCECGAQYNAFGQRLRGDWRGNRSNYDENVGDMEGYEAQMAGDE